MEDYILTLYDENGNPIPIPAIQGVGIKEIRRREIDGAVVLETVLDDDRVFAFEIVDGAIVRYVPSQVLRVGDNVLTDDMVTLGAGWSGNLTDGFTHTSGSTEPLVFAVGAADGESYIIAGTIPNTAAERAILLSLGDSFETDPYNGKAALQWGLTCVGDNGALKIIPASGLTGTFENLTLRKVSDDGANEVEIELGDIYHADMPNHLTGFWNIALGDHALENSVNGTRNIALGYYSERALKTGSRNIGIGTFSMSQMESGDRNIAIGADSLYTPQKAESCIAIGTGTLSKGNEHSYNVAIGQNAMYGANKGKYKDSVAIGFNAGYYGGAQSSSNVFIGASAGYENGGYMNTFIGGNTAQKATGHTCTAIGAQATTESYNGCVAIGYQAKNTKHNQVVLGADSNVETVLKGDLIVRGTDGKMRQIVFNADGTCSWTEVT